MTVGPGGSVHIRVFKHTVFLMSASADSPARQKMAMWPTAAAYFACGWCMFEGYKRQGESGMHFDGYAAPAEQHMLQLPPCKVGDDQLQLTDELHHQRARLVQSGELSASIAGCTGLSAFPQILSYINYADFWELPIYHAGEQELNNLYFARSCSGEIHPLVLLWHGVDSVWLSVLVPVECACASTVCSRSTIKEIILLPWVSSCKQVVYFEFDSL